MDDLSISSKVASAGMKAQATRLRVISENLANADSTSEIPGREPYRRKLITFRNALNKDGEGEENFQRQVGTEIEIRTLASGGERVWLCANPQCEFLSGIDGYARSPALLRGQHERDFYVPLDGL
jgi:flagellar basal body rod protein FlgC